MRRRSVYSTGAPLSSLTAANFTRGSGSRRSRCRTIGTAAARAPIRNSGDRNDGISGQSDARSLHAAIQPRTQVTCFFSRVDRYDSRASSSGSVVFSN